MASPQPTDAHIRIAHSITEQIMISDFSKRQRKILDLILRLSWGCGKKDAIIPRQKDFEITGIHEVDIKDEIDCLITRKVIIRKDNIYSFNKDYEKWRVSTALKYSPKKLSKLLSLNLKRDDIKDKNLVFHEEETSSFTKSSKAKSVTAKESIKETTTTVSKKECNIFQLFEENISQLTPMVADELKLLEKDYPEKWIGWAIEEAVKNNVRKLSYISSILKNWQANGVKNKPRNQIFVLKGKYD